MTAHPEIALTATPTTKLVVIRSCRWWCLCISQRVFAAAAPITGVESRKEKRAAAVRSRLRKRPALMVMPLRETPGTTASACASPMDSASGAPTADMSRCWRAAFSARRPPVFSPQPHQHADGDQHGADDERVAPRALRLLVEQQAGHTHRNAGDRQQPGQQLIGV